MTDALGFPWPSEVRQLRIGDLEIDLRYRQVSSPEQTVELPQRAFDLLLEFLASPHALHTRAMLFDQVWQGVIVEDANLSQSIWLLRKALGPSRKQWIRTVAKRGYVFEPPCPVEPVLVNATDAIDGVEAGLDGLPAAEPSEVRIGGPEVPEKRLHLWLVATGLAALAAIAVVLAPKPTPLAPIDAATAPVAVALIEVGNNNDAEAHWPAILLYAWLEWKLESLPEVIVMSEAHLAADAASLSPTVVLLSSGQAANQPGERFVRARITDADGTRQLELRGNLARIPALVDQLSQQILTQLIPGRDDTPWPTLDIDASAARSYTIAYRDYRDRDMSASAAGLQSVVGQSPGFGLAQLQLAMSRARLGQANAAVAHMQTARELLVPIGDDTDQVLDAAQLWVDPRRVVEASAAITALADRYPKNLRFRLDQAWFQLRSGQADLALESLAGVEWQRQPISLRIPWLICLAEIAGARGDLAGMRTHAMAAEQLARDAGPGWEPERAIAIHLKAQVDVAEFGDEADMSQFEQAATLFAAAGAELDALHVRVSAELSKPPSAPSTQLDTLLARSHAGGYRSMEVQLLRRVAFQHYHAGNLAEYRKRLDEALAIAVAAGDAPGQRALQLDLLNEDALAGRFDQARERVRLIRSQGLKGNLAVWLDQLEAIILTTEGDYTGALEVLEHTVKRLAREDLPPLPTVVSARLACARVTGLLSLGRMQQARMALERCGLDGPPELEDQLVMHQAAISLLAGDAASASPRLQTMVTRTRSMEQGPHRWLTALQTAPLLARAGQLEEADALYTATHDALQGSGYAWLLAQTEVGQAETAAARGRWTQAMRHAEAARQTYPNDTWMQSHRLDLVAILHALADNRPEAAQSLLARSHARAHALGDVAVQLELHSLMAADGRLDDCDVQGPAAGTQVATTGMRGANVDWMTPWPAGREATIAAAPAHNRDPAAQVQR
ncbi:winged helix-turn-helix domain-containing protein [Lysobacter sp. A378]